jgi:SAM-dependent methyltransferase
MPDTQPSGAPAVTPERIMQMGFGYAPPLIIEAAIRNKVFDTLDTGPRTIAELSRENGASERGLRIVMDALVGLEFLARDAEGRYSLTPESAAFLVSGKPAYRGGMFQHTVSQILKSWMQLGEIVQTGQPALALNQQETGASFFAEFVEALFANGYPAALALGEALKLNELPQPVKILDIAAGSGVWSIGVAQKTPGAQITAVDFPEVLPGTRRVCARFGLDDQLKCIAGDLLEVDFGAGYQVATLGHILHCEGRDWGRALLKKVYAALAPGGAIAIAEMIPNDDRTGPPFPLVFAVNMLVNTQNGDTYTFGEMSQWLTEAGFTDCRLLEVPAPSPLILATKPA